MTNNDNKQELTSNVTLISTTVEIDCAPMMPRPDTYFKHICSEILHCDYFNPFSKFFGNWEWNVKVTEEQRLAIESYLTEVYNQGKIRYASW